MHLSPDAFLSVSFSVTREQECMHKMSSPPYRDKSQEKRREEKSFKMPGTITETRGDNRFFTYQSH